MTITLGALKESINDYRIDSTPGMVNTNNEGLRAINGFLDWLYTAHEFPSQLKDENLWFYPRNPYYPLPENFICCSAIYPYGMPYEQFRLKTPQNLMQRIQFSTVGNYIAYDRSRDPKMLLTYYGGRGSYQELSRFTSTVDSDFIYSIQQGISDLWVEPNFDGTTGAHVSGFIDQSAQTAGLSLDWQGERDLSSFGHKCGFVLTCMLPEGVKRVGLHVQNTGQSTNYMWATSQVTGQDFSSTEVNHILFPIDGVGFPMDKVNGFQLQFTSDSDPNLWATGNFSLLKLEISTPQLFSHRFYTYSLVRDAVTGEYKTHFDGIDDSDELNLPDECMELVSKGAVWKLFQMMDKKDKAEETRLEVMGQSGKAGLFGQIRDKYPSMRKEPEAPQFIPAKKLNNGYAGRYIRF